MAIGTIALFYGVFFLLGLWAGRWAKSKSTTNELFLAGRRLPLWLAICTLIATWVCGGYIVGTAEAIYDPSLGLLWTQAPWCFALSLVAGGVFFAVPMRRRRCVTMLDLFEQRFGSRMAVALYIPAVLAELFWIAAVLAALGQVFATMLQLNATTSILISAVVALIYTLVGGLWSVALTDAAQLLCIVGGLLVVLPFALEAAGGWEQVLDSYRQVHPATFRMFPSANMPAADLCRWFDMALLLVLGGIPWQVYFQRVLACRSDRAAVWLSVVAGIGCFLCAIPPAIIGMIGSTVDWSAYPGAMPQAQSVLPAVMRYLTPEFVGVLGLCAVAAAVMSSIDSSMLSASSMFAWNVYRPLRAGASDRGIQLVMRVAMIIVAAAAAVLAIRVSSVYNLWALSADLIYVILFPQLLCALFIPSANRVGAAWGAAIGLVLRVAGGESSLGIPAVWEFPAVVPFRTTVMLISLATICAVSRMARTPASVRDAS